MKHDIRVDGAGPEASHERYTCYGQYCREATLVRQPYMTRPQWNLKLAEFLKQHGAGASTRKD